MSHDRIWPRGKDERPWYEAIADYDERFVSQEVDCLAWEIYSLGGFERDFPPDLRRQLDRACHGWGELEPLPPDALPRLREIRDRAEAWVRAQGWEPGPRLRVIRRNVRERYAS